MGRDASPVSDRVRLEILEGGQRELVAALTDIKATLNQLSVESAETRRMVQHVGERRAPRSSPSRHTRSRAEARYESPDYESRGLRREEEHRWADRRRGGRVEGRGIEVERWLEGAGHSRASDGRHQGN